MKALVISFHNKSKNKLPERSLKFHVDNIDKITKIT